MGFTAQCLNKPTSHHEWMSFAYMVHKPFLSVLFLVCN